MTKQVKRRKAREWYMIETSKFSDEEIISNHICADRVDAESLVDFFKRNWPHREYSIIHICEVVPKKRGK